MHSKQTKLRNIRLRTHAIPAVTEIMFQNDILTNCLKRVVTKRRVLYLATPPTKKRIYVHIWMWSTIVCRRSLNIPPSNPLWSSLTSEFSFYYYVYIFFFSSWNVLFSTDFISSRIQPYIKVSRETRHRKVFQVL